MAEDKKWDKLRNKWKTKKKVKEQKPPIRMKEIIYRLKNYTIVLLLIAVPLFIGAVLIIYPRYLSPAETDTTFAMTGLSTGEIEKIYMTSGKKNECYWITPTFDRGYYLEIRKYNSTTNDCYGNLIDETVIPLDGPVNIIGNTDCICSKRMQIKRIEVDGDIFFEVKTVGII